MNAVRNDNTSTRRGSNDRPQPARTSRVSSASPRATTSESDSNPPSHGADVAGRERSPPRRANADIEIDAGSDETKIELGSDDEDEGQMAHMTQTPTARHQDQAQARTNESDSLPPAREHHSDDVAGRGRSPPQHAGARTENEDESEDMKVELGSDGEDEGPMVSVEQMQAANHQDQEPKGWVEAVEGGETPRSDDYDALMYEAEDKGDDRENAAGNNPPQVTAHLTAAAQLMSRGQRPSAAASSRAPMSPSSPSQRTPSRPQQAVGWHEAASGRANRAQPATAAAAFSRVPMPSSRPARPSRPSRAARGGNDQGGRNGSSAGGQLQQQPDQTTAPTLNSASSPPSDEENTQPPTTLEATLVQSAEATLIDPNHDAFARNSVPLYEATRISNIERYKVTIIVGVVALVIIGAMAAVIGMLAGRGSDGAGGDQQTLSNTPVTPPPIFIITDRPTPQLSMSPIGPEPLSIMPSKDPGLSNGSSEAGGDQSITSPDPPGLKSTNPSLSVGPTSNVATPDPTPQPSMRPSVRRTDGPVPSTVAPTQKPTPLSTTQKPTVSPSVRTPRPSLRPLVRPTQRPVPVTVAPTPKPSLSPMTELQSSGLELVQDEEIVSHLSNKNVAIHGNTAVVGAPSNDNKRGLVFVYIKDDNDKWLQQAKLVAPDGAAGDRFGWSVGIHGDTVIIGAYYDDDNGRDSGSAHVFVRDGVTWTHLAKLVAPDGAATDRFGGSVGIYDDALVVGADGDDDNGAGSGSVHLFARNGNAWTHQAKLVAPDGAVGDYFGTSEGIFGDTLVIGAQGDGDNGGWSGSAYLFVRNNDDWTYQAKLLAPDGAADDYFGCSVAIFGDTVVVGARGDDDKGSKSGSAYLFARINDTWMYQAKLVAPDGASADLFGASVGIYGDVVIVGSYGDDDIGGDSGSAHAFGRNGTAWTHHAKLLAPRTGEGFGTSVGIYDGTIISGSRSGEAYVFSG